MDKQYLKQVKVGNNTYWFRADTIKSRTAYTDTGIKSMGSCAQGVDVGQVVSDKIIGGSIIWNQLASNGNFDSVRWWTTVGCTYTVADNIATLTKTGENPAAIYKTIGSEKTNHKFLISAEIKGPAYVQIARSNWGSDISTSEQVVDDSEFHRQVMIGNLTSPYYMDVRFKNSVAPIGSTAEVRNVQFIDLTQMFGAAVADYIYTQEVADHSGCAIFRQLFYKPYYAYAPYTLLSVNTVAHRAIDFNAYNQQTGKAIVVADQLYQITGSYTSLSADSGEVLTIDSAGKFMPIFGGSITVTGGDATTCVHLVWSGRRDAEYEAYTERSYSLADIELLGIPRIVDDKIVYDGDVYNHDGTIIRNYAKVDLGTLDWSTSGGTYPEGLAGFCSRSINSTLEVPTSNSAALRAISTKFIAGSYKDLYSTAGITQDCGIVAAASADTAFRLRITVSAGQYADAAAFKAAMSGVYLVYKVQSPTTETVASFEDPQILDDFGIDEYVDGRVAAGTQDVTIPAGHETTYLSVNLKDKLQRLPNLPSAADTYVIKYDGAICSFEKYVDPVVEDKTLVISI